MPNDTLCLRVTHEDVPSTLVVVVVVVCVLVTQLCLTPCDLMDCSPPGSSVHEDSPGKNTGVSCHFRLQGAFLIQGVEPRSPALQADALLSELLGKPMLVLEHYDYYTIQFCILFKK